MVGDEQTTRHVECGAVTVATGLSVPNAPSTIKGIDLTTGYEDLPVDGQSYEGKSVAVLGTVRHLRTLSGVSRLWDAFSR